MGIFDKRVNYKPFEYTFPQTIIDAINKVYWVHSEVDFTSDVQDYKTRLNDKEREAYKRAFLSISQIEVAVKTFWGKLYDYFPKPEFNALGATLAENEQRHESAYSRGLELLGLEKEFETLLEVSAMKARLDLADSVMGNKSVPIELKLLFFTLVIENSALFSQFAIGMSFQRFKGFMKNISNMISWTVYEEVLHSEVGIWFINEIKKEREVFEDLDIKSTVEQYIKVEEDVLDWIFEKGELEFISKEQLLNFVKHRMDEALEKIGFAKVFNVEQKYINQMNWFNEEIYSNSLADFFASRPTDYTKHDKSITEDDLF